MVRLTDHPDMTLDVYRGRKTTTQQQRNIVPYAYSIIDTDQSTRIAMSQEKICFLRGRKFFPVRVPSAVSGIMLLHSIPCFTLCPMLTLLLMETSQLESWVVTQLIQNRLSIMKIHLILSLIVIEIRLSSMSMHRYSRYEHASCSRS